jgi:hypothetical protein
MTAAAQRHGVLLLSCPDALGIVHAIAEQLVTARCTIIESQQFRDAIAGTFFMRVEFMPDDDTPLDLETMRAKMATLADRYGMTWHLTDAAHRQRVVIMVSKFAHCLNDLLFRNSIGELNLDVVGVVSNHHADPVQRPLQATGGSGDQHPPLDAAQLQVRPPLPPGARSGREVHRCHRTLRHGRSRRGADHRAAVGPRGPLVDP